MAAITNLCLFNTVSKTYYRRERSVHLMLVGLLQEFPVISQVFFEFASVLPFRECGELRFGQYKLFAITAADAGGGAMERASWRRAVVTRRSGQDACEFNTITSQLICAYRTFRNQEVLMKYRLLRPAKPKAKGFRRWGWGGGRSR